MSIYVFFLNIFLVGQLHGGLFRQKILDGLLVAVAGSLLSLFLMIQTTVGYSRIERSLRIFFLTWSENAGLLFLHRNTQRV
jgi:hypothetical protein